MTVEKNANIPTKECTDESKSTSEIQAEKVVLESTNDLPDEASGSADIAKKHTTRVVAISFAGSLSFASDSSDIAEEETEKDSDPVKDIEANLGATESSDETLHEDDEDQFHKAEEETTNLIANLFFLESLFVLGAYLFAVHEILGFSAQSFVLWAYGVLYIARLNAKVRWFTHRELTSTDLTWVILCWVPGAMLSIACLAVPVAMNDTVMIFSLILYTLGWAIGVRSEWQRKAWEDDPKNWGKLYTSGLFARSRHINYFCQVVLFIGWALASASPFNAWIPIVVGIGFVFFQIPKKEERLAKHFAEEWKEYVKNTPSAFVPCLNTQTSSR